MIIPITTVDITIMVFLNLNKKKKISILGRNNNMKPENAYNLNNITRIILTYRPFLNNILYLTIYQNEDDNIIIIETKDSKHHHILKF